MRLIYSGEDQHKAYALSSYLLQEGVENELELHSNTDWGSPEYGTVTCRIWVIDEDQVEKALMIHEEFLSDPENPKFHHLNIDAHTSATDGPASVSQASPASKARLEKPPMGPLTLYLLIACTLIYLFSALTEPAVKAIPNSIPYAPILYSPIYKTMLYDYPHAYEIIDQLVTTHGVEALSDPASLPKASQELLADFQHTPYWQGMYGKIMFHLKHPEAPWDFSAPMFEKIRQGEFWRLFTPGLLHSDLFHLFFNMIWLVVLGKQLEQRLGKWRYVLFIVITAIISNTAQYLMSGPNFLGFSGVLCAMLMFIWMRQRRAAWEGYLLQAGTMAFITFFVLFMFSLQLISFFVELYSDTSMSLSIANTAHIAGAISGYFLAKTNYFAWNR